MCCEITKNKAIILTLGETIVFGARTTGIIIGAIAAGTTLATVALSVTAAVAGIFTLISLGNFIISCGLPPKSFKNEKIGWASLHIFTFIALQLAWLDLKNTNSCNCS